MSARFSIADISPFWLGSTTDRVLTVVSGEVELFLIDAVDARRHHLATIPAGACLFDIGFQQNSTRLLCVGQPDTLLASAEPTPRALESWLNALRQGLTAWPEEPAPSLFQCSSPSDLPRVHEQILAIARRGIEREGQDEQLRHRNRIQLQGAVRDRAWKGIASVLDSGTPPPESASASSGHAATRLAFQRVARAMSIVPHEPPDIPASHDPLFVLADLARASSVRWRKVTLTHDWHRRDNGPLIGFLAANNAAVALLPVSPRKYRLHHEDGTSQAVTPAIAAQLHPTAVCLYRTLPNRRLHLRDILQFTFSGHVGDFWLIAAMVIVTGVLGLASPALTGRIFDVIVPQAERGLMMQIGAALLTAALVKAMFELTRGLALLRVETRADFRLQAAVWDRLVKLPADFFRKYTAGDLANRAQGITEVHQIFSSVGTTLIFTLPTGLFNLIVMFYHSWQLALVGFGLALLGTLVTIFFSAKQILILREQYEIRGRLAGTVLQLINGVAKFRIAAAESFAFATWAKPYADQERLSMRAGGWSVASQTFLAGFSLLCSCIIFGVVAWRMGFLTADGNPPTALPGAAQPFTTGAFLSFNAAFGALVMSLITAGQSSLNALQILPLLERTKPIFDALPESSEGRAHPGTLGGEIELSNVRFSYGRDLPAVLDGLSLKIQAGQMVAIVGPSGCGKSTILRLLLGFESPETGSVFYDGRDLTTLDLHEVRRQIGTVMQDTRLVTGDIYRNIVGESNLTIDDAWQAAEMSGLADDIRAMPMQMHTIVSEGGGGFSGGQRQRLAIARAFVRKPKLLFFDEATSALDNRTQATVTSSLEKFRSTRIIIAHRLSTIAKADRILVIADGRVAEDGTYDELMAAKGRFHALAQRQLA